MAELVQRADAEGAAAVRAWLTQLPWAEHGPWGPIVAGIHDAHLEHDAAAYISDVRRAGYSLKDVRTRQEARPTAMAQWPTAFRYLLARPSMMRLGRTP